MSDTIRQKAIEYAKRTVNNLTAMAELHKSTSDKPAEYPAVDGPVDKYQRQNKAHDAELLLIWNDILGCLNGNEKKTHTHQEGQDGECIACGEVM